MNTGKQVNAMVIILFLALIAIGSYTIWDPFRADDAEGEQLDKAAERGAETFALNCRLCHGDRGQGGQLGGRLPQALPLNTDTLQGIKDGMFSRVRFDEQFKFVTDTITCGRVGRFMPAWSVDQGGTLNEEQIRQLAVLITEGRWDFALEHADEIDAGTTGHATVQMPSGSLTANAPELIVSNAGPFSEGQYVRIDEERLRILPKRLQVVRGTDGTEAVNHASGTRILRADETQTDQTLAEEISVDGTALVVSDTAKFTVGETLQLGEERVRVTDIETGIPGTGRTLVEGIGKTPREFLVSGAQGIEVGQIIRLDGELMEVTGIRDDGDPGIALDANVDGTSATRISVSDPVFFRSGYVMRVDGEQIRVVDAVLAGQTLGETIGRAETTFFLSGTEGIAVGDVIRLDSELLRVTEILQPATVDVERGVDGTTARSHNAGVTFVKADGEEDEDPETGQALLLPAQPGDTTFTITGSANIAIDGTYDLGGELVQITVFRPARIRVERGIEGTDRGSHSRRISIFVGNLLEVERGVNGTSAETHSSGDTIFMTEIDVRRGAEDSTREDHVTNADIFLGNGLIVERGVLNTEPGDHPNGTLVLDFPLAPTGLEPIEQTCGQRQVVQPTPSGPTATPAPTPAGAESVAVSLIEFAVAPDVTSVAAGPVVFTVTNDGSQPHNLRVIATDLAPDALPTEGAVVDESAVNVVGRTPDFGPGETQTVVLDDLPAGNYVLICNVPAHYFGGMRISFEVTGP
ncbi:MAG: c-type cytochrome [Chloroflexi bacterium]|nr:c-type cytochrome [Chloroflexota bacterium]